MGEPVLLLGVDGGAGLGAGGEGGDPAGQRHLLHGGVQEHGRREQLHRPQLRLLLQQRGPGGLREREPAGELRGLHAGRGLRRAGGDAPGRGSEVPLQARERHDVHDDVREREPHGDDVPLRGDGLLRHLGVRELEGGAGAHRPGGHGEHDAVGPGGAEGDGQRGPRGHGDGAGDGGEGSAAGGGGERSGEPGGGDRRAVLGSGLERRPRGGVLPLGLRGRLGGPGRGGDALLHGDGPEDGGARGVRLGGAERDGDVEGERDGAEPGEGGALATSSGTG